MRGKRMSFLQRKGLLTLLLILIAETVTLTNAVSFWTRYGTSGRGEFGQFYDKSKGDKEASAVRECVAADARTGKCEERSLRKHPPAQFRLAKRVDVRAATSAAYASECCSSCPQCLRIRGGNSNVAKQAVDAAAGAASAAAAGAVGAAASSATPYNIPLNMWKVIFQAFLTALNVVCWLVPLRSKNISENKLGMSLANAFSGGVFLSLAFGHLLPECVHGFHDHNEVLPYMLVLFGYLLIFFVEKVAFDADGLLHGDQSTPGQEGKGAGTTIPEGGEEGGRGGSRSAVILLGALAVHSILEMTALGLADTFGDSALLSLSIALHQPAESIALLVAFLKSGMPKDDIVKFLSAFSLMGPIGVGVGMAVNEFAAPIVDAIMLAVVAGTFIYVGATEVIPEEWEEQEHKWKKFFALISGIVSIFAITQYTMTLEG